MQKIFIVFFLIALSINAYASSKLTNLSLTSNKNNKLQIIFKFDQPNKFQIEKDLKKGIIKLYFSDAELIDNKKILNLKLDKNFIKKIDFKKLKSNIEIYIHLTSNSKFISSKDIIKNDNFYYFIELEKSLELAPTKTIAKKFIVMIDPGHGGSDSGASNKNILEKNLVLDYALALKKELAKYPGYEIFLTREKDQTLSLNERMNKANKVKADVYISLHADSNENKKLSGASVYTLSKEALEEENQNLLSRANKASILKNEQLLKQNKEIANVIIGMVYQDTQNSSLKLAEITSDILSKEINMLNKHQRVAGFKVLKKVDIPAILIEIGYLSNDKDLEILQSKLNKKIFARAMAKAINQYTSTR